MNDVISKMEEMLEEIRKQRDELQVKLHLAGMEAKEEWHVLEQKLNQLEAKTKELGGAAAESSQDIGAAAKLLGEEILAGFRNIGRHF